MNITRATSPAVWSALFTATLTGVAVAGTTATGPSSSDPPYVAPSMATVETIALLTVGDTPTDSAYRMVGIPDGLGAFDNTDGTFTVLMNHELSVGSGSVRDHGGRGAFVSRWVIDKQSLEVIGGNDLIQNVFLWNTSQGSYQTTTNTTFSRFCSGDLPASSAFYNAATGKGTQVRIYTNGEETGATGRVFAHLVDGPNAGTTYELPRAGNCSFENAVAAPDAGDTTVLIGLDDSSTGQLYIYVGTKTASGNEIERAGLTNGILYGLVVTGLPFENTSNGLGGVTTRPFSMHSFGDVSNVSGSTLQTLSRSNLVTEFRRPEDGHFRPGEPNAFYWCSTGASGAPTRLWRLRFNDITNPALGGMIDMLLSGVEGPVSMDNLTATVSGKVLVQEDAGSSSRLAKIWMYDIAADTVTEVAAAAADFFTSGQTNFITTNEESSGVIDVRDILGPGWFLINMQAHASAGDSELVERGQFLALRVPQAAGPFAGDLDGNGLVNLADYELLADCLAGPVSATPPPGCSPSDFSAADIDSNGTVDLRDVAAFEVIYPY